MRPLLAALLIVFALDAGAQPYPTRSIKIVVPPNALPNVGETDVICILFT